MPDISEVWNSCGYLVAPAIASVLLCASLKIHRRWLRIASSGISVLLLLVSGIVLFMGAYFDISDTMRIPNLISPDGKHVAVVTWTLVGAVGFDHVHVKVRHRYSPFAKEVETGLAQQPPEDPVVRWIDSKSLLISYWKNGQISPCDLNRRTVEGITILCQQ